MEDAGFDERQVLHPSKSHDTTLNLAKEWLNKCRAKTGPHKDCAYHQPDEIERPKRLVWCGDVASGEPARICAGDELDKSEEYLTLSHAWGRDPSSLAKLANDNLEDWKARLPLDLLSQAFRDAIHVTRKLGFSCIWIDCLCILQDSKEDWEMESRKMASYYKNTALNISATGYADGRLGFLESNHRDVNQLLPCQYYADMDGKWHDSVVDRRGHYRVYRLPEEPIDTYPLSKRGWVMQERLLSPRVLHFGPSQLMWECFGTTCSEHRGLFPKRINGDVSPVRSAKPFVNSAVKSSAWHGILNSYSAMDLSFASDKLVALSGVAAEMATRRSCNYLAGLWENSLLDDLIWYIDRGIYHTGGPEKPAAPQPDKYRAPSWSWSSLDECVQFFSGVYHEYAAIVEASTTCSTLNRFGPVSDGYIRIQGFLRECRLHQGKVYDVDDKVGLQFRFDFRSPPEQRKRNPTGRCESEEYDLDTMSKIYLLSIKSTEPGVVYDMRRLYGLILGLTHRAQGEYFRLGVFEKGYDMVAFDEQSLWLIAGPKLGPECYEAVEDEMVYTIKIV